MAECFAKGNTEKMESEAVRTCEYPSSREIGRRILPALLLELAWAVLHVDSFAIFHLLLFALGPVVLMFRAGIRQKKWRIIAIGIGWAAIAAVVGCLGWELSN